MAALIKFITTDAAGSNPETYIFSSTGRAQYARAVRYESDAPNSPPRRAIVTWNIGEWFMEPSFADNQARLTALRTALRRTEGVLYITDENGSVLHNVRVRAESNDLPEQWGQYLASINIIFTGVEDLADTTLGLDASYIPAGNPKEITGVNTGGNLTVVGHGFASGDKVVISGNHGSSPSINGTFVITRLDNDHFTVPVSVTVAGTGGQARSLNATPIALGNAVSIRHTIKTDRYDPSAPNRREITGTIVASGKIRANPNDDIGTRRSAILAAKEQIEACPNSAEGLFAWASISQVLKVEAFDCDLADGSDELKWTLTGFYRRFPSGDDYTLVEFDVSQKEDIEKHEIVTSVRGNVRAPDEAGARAKAADLLATYTVTGRILKVNETSVKKIEGDVDGLAFIQLNFNYELREVSTAGASWTLSINDKKDLKTGMVISTYSGTVTAADTATAVAMARTLGDGMYPVRLDASETVQTLALGGSDGQFQQVTFSYSYQHAGDWSFAEVSGDTDRQTFGRCTMTVSGYAVGPDEATALALARTFKSGSLLELSVKETPQTYNLPDVLPDPVVQPIRVTFSYTYHVVALGGSIRYEKKASIDYNAREKTTAWTGTAYAATESAADTLISALLTGATGRRGIDERSTKWDQAGSTVFVERTFNITRIEPISAGGDDILDANYSVKQVGSIQKAVITFIPQGTPFVQTNCGQTPGHCVVSGTCTALTRSTAVAWGQALRASASTGGYEDPPEEEVETVYYPLSGSSVKCYRFKFTYAGRYTTLTL